jgi:hypothetical protein
MPSPTLAKVEAHVFRAPIQEPVRTSFGTMAERVAVFVKVEDSDGARGWGEIWSNFPTASAEHRALLFADIVAPRALGKPLDDPVALWAEIDRGLHVLRVQSGDAGALRPPPRASTRHPTCAQACPPLWHAGRTDIPRAVYARASIPLRRPTRSSARVAAIAPTRSRSAGEEADLGSCGRWRASRRRTADGRRQPGWDLATACWMAPKSPSSGWTGSRNLVAGRPLERGRRRRPDPACRRREFARCWRLQEAVRLFGIIQPDAANGRLIGCLPVARAALAAGRTYCPHFLGGAIGLMHSLHLLAAVRGPGLLEVDANPNPLREGLLGDLLAITEGCVSLPDGQGLGLEPDLKPLANLRSLHIERHA